MKKILEKLRIAVPILMASAGMHAAAQIGDDRLCADQNSDGMVTPTDFTAWISNYNAGNPVADVNQDGSVTPTDFTAWINAFNLGENGPACFVDLSDGGSVEGSISYVGDVDTFTVNADAGDDLLFSISETPAGPLYLDVKVYDPSGQLVGSNFVTSSTRGFRLDLLDIALSGTYTYVVRDHYDSYLGNYTFTCVVADSSLDTGNIALTSGQTMSATVGRGDIDTYTIEADAGDDLLFTIEEHAGSSLYLRVALYGPVGQLLDSAYVTSSTTGFRLDALDVPSDGRYTFIVRDQYGYYTGDCSFTALVLDENTDVDNTAISSGVTNTGTIEIGDIDTFTILADAGDDLLFTIKENAGSDLYLRVALHGPNGQLLGTQYVTSSTTGFRLDLLDIPQSGRYTYVVRDQYGYYSGSYNFTAIVADEHVDTDNTQLSSGTTIAGNLGVGDIDTFTIDASAGDDLYLTIEETAGSSAYLRVALLGPHGQLLDTQYVTSSTTGFRLDHYEVPAAGRYTYVVRDHYGYYTGGYQLTANVMDNSIDNDNVMLTSGQTTAGSIEIGDIDTFTINADAGDDLLLTIAETAGSDLYLRVALHGPNGQLLDVNYVTSSTPGFRLDFDDVPASGTYTYVVRDHYGYYTGNYSMTVVVADENIDADNTALANGQSENGMLERGDIDTYTITASAGQDLLMSIAETAGSNAYLRVALHGPNGQHLATEYVTSSTPSFDLDYSSVPQSGTYTYIVRDQYGHYTGGYEITASKVN